MRSIQINLDVNDDEYANFLRRLAERGTVTTATDTAGDADGDAAGDIAAPVGALDKNGVPWIDSVHASTKGVTKEGLWRGKKGVKAEDRAKIEAAWKAANPPVAANGGFTTAGAVASGPPVTMPGMPGAAMALPGGMPGMPGFTPPVPPVSYDDLVKKFQEVVGAGKFDPANAMAMYTAAGVTNVNELMTNETLRRAVMNELLKVG